LSIAGVGANITNIVGMGLVAGVAVKTIDMVNNQTKRKSKSKSKVTKSKSKGKKGKSSKRRNDDDIFGMGSFY